MKKYRAIRTSSFMPFDEGNKWIVESPSGEIIHDGAATGRGMTQNEAIRFAKEKNNPPNEVHLPWDVRD